MIRDYAGLIVPKMWGYEYVLFQTPDVAIWMLHIRAGQATSLHFHPNKRTTLVLLSGDARVRVGSETVFLEKAESVFIDKRVEHSTLALTDCWVMETESPPQKTDLVRVGDNYGRTGSPYETDVIQFTTAAAFPAMGFRP